MPLNVGYYLGECSLSHGGVAPYALRMLRQLGQSHMSPPITIFGDLDETTRQFLNTSRMQPRFASSDAPLSLVERFSHRFRLLGNVLTQQSPRIDLPEYDPIYRRIEQSKIDLLHVPYQTPPVFKLPCPYLVTMHDVQELYFPQYFSAEIRATRATNYLRAIRESAAIVVSFDHVKQDLIRFFNCPPEKVHVVGLAYDQCQLPPPSDQTKSECQQRYADKKPFFLYPAQTWPHKNHLALLTAFDRLQKQTPTPSYLICTGKRNEHYFNEIEPFLKTLACRDRILFTDIVSDQELSWLYENTHAVVVPTLYEAGSFPVIEGMMHGAPVICSNVTSLPDTMANQEYLFDPTRPEELLQLMTLLLTNDSFRNKNQLHCQSRGAELRNDLTATQRLIDVWKKIMSSGNFE